MLIQQIVNGLLLGSVYVLVALSFTLSVGILNFLNFSLPGLFMLGGMIAWILLMAGFPPAAAAAVALAVACVLSVVVERLTFARMRDSEPEVPLVSSLGFLLLFEHLMLVRYGSDQQTVPQVAGSGSFEIGGVIIGTVQLTSLVIALMIVVLLSWILKRSRFGRGVRAIAEDAGTAAVLGVDVRRLVLAVFVASGAIAAFAGILFAVNYGQVSPFMGEEIGLKAISAMILGGMGSVWGAIAGGLLIGLAEMTSIFLFGSDFVDLCVYGLLLAILMVRPQGLFGKGHRMEKL